MVERRNSGSKSLVTPVILGMFVLLIALVAGFVANFYLTFQETARTKAQLGYTSQLKALSQEIAKNSYAASQGQVAVFASLAENKSAFDAALGHLKSGNPVQGLPAASREVKSRLRNISTLWTDTRAQVEVVLNNREGMVYLRDITGDLAITMSAIQQENNKIVASLLRLGIASNEIVLVQRQAQLIERMSHNVDKIIEIGAGMGILTSILLEIKDEQTWVIDIDEESINYLNNAFPAIKERLIHADILKFQADDFFTDSFALIGNLPYNISSQIFFKLLALKNEVPEMVCMVQKEVAERIASPPGNKTYGILSVLLGAFFDIEYLFTVKPDAFNPQPRVNSAVMRFTRNQTAQLSCDEKSFFRVVKQGFQNRRKTLRNSLKPLNLPEQIKQHPFLSLRAEQLSVADFVELTSKIEAWKS